MSSSDYEKYIIEKFRLAVAIAVIKTKPKKLSVVEYLNILKSKINDPTSDDDITICEDDFNIDDNDSIVDVNNDESNDSETILKNFNLNFMDDENQNSNSLLHVMQVLKNIDDSNNKAQGASNSQTTHVVGRQNLQIDFNNVGNNLDDNITFCDDLAQIRDSDQNKETIDSQQTELYTVQGFTEYNTHISQSQDNFVVSKNLLTNKTKSELPYNIIEVKTVPTKTAEVKLTSNNNLNGTFFNNNDNITKNKLPIVIESNKRFKLNNETQITLEGAQFSSQNRDNNENRNIFNDILDTNSDYSQILDFTLESTNITRSYNEIANRTQNTYSFDEFEYFTQSNRSFKTNNCTDNSGKETHDKNCDEITNINIINNIENINNMETNGNQNANKKVLSNFNENVGLENHNKNITVSPILNKSNNIQNFGNVDNNDFNTINDGEVIENGVSDEGDLSDTQIQIVTFKVLEELSKVNNYLNRKERRASKTDSGYKSFQLRDSCDSASQSSGFWINESAHCLMFFITTSPLLINTCEITDEISKVLGKLVDKLHDDETYPNFLEEMLDTVTKLLNEIYEGRNYGENILNKDEMIQRLLLLNRSSHLIKYTIEKITDILEDTLRNVNNIEILHTTKSENICYIFYILEDLLKRISQYKNISSQSSSQNSQEILKKSSLTEIWRKKWNLSKNEIFEGSCEKKCALTKCRVVLNKIIVEAMDGYSLMSFAALQCYNLLQN